MMEQTLTRLAFGLQMLIHIVFVYIFPVVYGETSCPNSFSGQKSRASMCASTTFYHCLYNEFGQITEICSQPIWVPKGNCPEYNAGASKLNYAKCKSSERDCPSESFLSSDLLKYQGCIAFQRTTATIETANTTMLTSTLKIPKKPSSALAFVSFIAIVVPIVFLIYILWRRKQNPKKGKEQLTDEESVKDKLLQTDNEIYPQFKVLSPLVETLEKSKAIIILGTWGSGKSTLARQIRERLDQSIRWIELSCLENWETLVPHNEKFIVKLEDSIKSWYSSNFKSEIKKKWTDLITKRPMCYFIIILRESECEKLGLKVSDKTGQTTISEKTGFSIETWKASSIFTEDEKRELIAWHLKRNNLTSYQLTQNSKDLKKSMEFSSNLMGFPGIVNLVCRNPRLLSRFEETFTEINEELKIDLEYLCSSKKLIDKCHFTVLVYAMLKGGKFNFNHSAFDVSLLKKVQDLYKLEITDPVHFFFTNPSFEYITFDSGKGGHCALEHCILARILFRIVSKENIDFLIENCDANLLLDCILTYEYKYLKSTSLDKLAARFVAIRNVRMDVIYHELFIHSRKFHDKYLSKIQGFV